MRGKYIILTTMKLRHLIIPLALGAFLSLAPRPAAAASEAVANIAVTAHLDKAGSLDITEAIDYDFGDTAPHDVIHGVPLSYHDDQGNNFNLTFKLLSATRDGAPLRDAAAADSNAVHFNLPSGSAAGTRHYELHYTLAPVVFHGDTHDIFKHNITGLSWAVPVNQVSFKLDSPGLVSADLTCLTGAQGSTSSSCQTSQDGDLLTVTATAPIPAGETLSAYCSFPHDSFGRYLELARNPLAWLPLALVGLVAAAFLAIIITGIVFLIRRHMQPPAPPES
ncbi:MAG: hypothetical protein JWN01_160 [Patescibacteria group bacterium]|nr:hypothetical protein [Patescibacteria group bacterium]